MTTTDRVDVVVDAIVFEYALRGAFALSFAQATDVEGYLSSMESGNLSRNIYRLLRKNQHAASLQSEYSIRLRCLCTDLLTQFVVANPNRSCCLSPELSSLIVELCISHLPLLHLVSSHILFFPPGLLHIPYLVCFLIKEFFVPFLCLFFVLISFLLPSSLFPSIFFFSMHELCLSNMLTLFLVLRLRPYSILKFREWIMSLSEMTLQKLLQDMELDNDERKSTRFLRKISYFFDASSSVSRQFCLEKIHFLQRVAEKLNSDAFVCVLQIYSVSFSYFSFFLALYLIISYSFFCIILNYKMRIFCLLLLLERERDLHCFISLEFFPLEI